MFRNKIGILIVSIITVFFCVRESRSQSYHVQKYNTVNGLKSRIILSAAQDSLGFIWFATDNCVSVYDGFEFRNFGSKDNFPQEIYKKVYTDTCGVVWALPLIIYDTILFYKDNTWKKITPLTKSESPLPAEFTSIKVMYENDKPVILAGATNGLYYYDGIWKKLNTGKGEGCGFVRNIFLFSGKYFICSNGGLYTFDGKNFDFSLLTISGGQPLYDGYPEKEPDGSYKIWLLETSRVGFLKDGRYVQYTDKFTLPSTLTMQYFAIAASKDYLVFGNEWGKFISDKTTGAVREIVKKNGFTTDGLTSLLVDRENDIWITDTRGADKFSDLDIESYTSGDGLLESEVTGIQQDENGSVIFSHNTGLTFFDGKKFTKYDFVGMKDYVYHSSRIQDMCVDKQNNVWLAASRMGLGKLNRGGKIEWYRYDDPNMSINSVICDNEGNIITLTSGGVFYLKNGKLINEFPIKHFKNSFRKIYEFGKDLYVIGLSGIFRISGGKVTELSHPDNVLAPGVYTLFKDPKGKFLAGGSDGIYEIKGDSLCRDKSFGINSPVYVIKSDLKNDIWVGTNNGIIRYNSDGSFKRFKRDNGLSGDEINRSALLISKSGDIWIGTEAGVSRILDNERKSNIPAVRFIYISDSKGRTYNPGDDISIDNSDNSLSFVFRGMSFVNEGLMTYRVKLEGYDEDWVALSQDDIGNIKYNNLKSGDYRMMVSVRNEGGGWSDIYSTGLITVQRPFYLKIWFMFLNLCVIVVVITFLANYRVTKRYNLRLNKEIEIKKMVEKALRESEEKYRSVIEQTDEGVVLMDSDSKAIIETNSAYERMLGYTKEELRKKTLLDIVDDDSESILERSGGIIDGTALKTEAKHIHKDGTRIPVEVNVSMIEYSGKKFICSLIRDISDRKTSEVKLRDSHEELKKAVAAKDKFFSILAHDLKSPFHGLLGYTELLLRGYREYSDEERMEIIDDLHVVSRNLFQLVSNLLQWSQIQTGRIKVVPESFGLYDLVETCGKTFKANFDNKNLTFTNLVRKDSVVYADKMMTDLIFRNLISNAVKFSNKGGNITFSSETVDGFECISIKDEGVGIPVEILPKLFEITTKYSSRGTEDEAGTGLGLILCSEMSEMNNGSITVDSVWGKGSTFTVRLPGNAGTIV